MHPGAVHKWWVQFNSHDIVGNFLAEINERSTSVQFWGGVVFALISPVFVHKWEVVWSGQNQ